MWYAQIDLSAVRAKVEPIGYLAAIEGKPLGNNVAEGQLLRRCHDGCLTAVNVDAEIAQQIAPLYIGAAAEGQDQFQLVFSCCDRR